MSSSLLPRYYGLTFACEVLTALLLSRMAPTIQQKKEQQQKNRSSDRRHQKWCGWSYLFVHLSLRLLSAGEEGGGGDDDGEASILSSILFEHVPCSIQQLLVVAVIYSSSSAPSSLSSICLVSALSLFGGGGGVALGCFFVGTLLIGSKRGSMISYLLLLLLPFLYILPLALEEEEMSPNMGAWWYLLIEVFRDFQPYFILVLAVYPMFYVAPLAIRLQPSAPLLQVTVMACIVTIFGANLDLRRLALVWSLFHPTASIGGSKQLVLGLGLSVSGVLMPVMRYLWLDARSGNANYFYFQSLVSCVFLCLVVLEFVVLVLQKQKEEIRRRSKRKETTE